MAMVCAQCNQVYDQSERICPVCQIQLFVYRRSTSDADDGIGGPAPGAGWQQTAWGRIVLALLLTQGLAFCLQQLCTAWLLASGDEVATWYTPFGIVGLHGFHAIALVLAGMLAGAGQERGVSNAAILGLWNGLIFLALHHASREVLPPWLFFAQPLLHLVFGMTGGLIGARIWPPVTVHAAADFEPATRTKGPARPARPWLGGRIHTIRVCLGASLAVTGVLFARFLMDQVLIQFPMLRVQSYFEEYLLRYQIAGLVVLVGGAFAGATTSNGFKQGLCAGLLAGGLYVGTQFANPKAVLEPTLFTSLGIFAVCIVGGMFGGALFPPVAARVKKAIPY